MNRTPGEITLFDIYTAIDPELMIIECMDPSITASETTGSKTPCLVHRVACGDPERAVEAFSA